MRAMATKAERGFSLIELMIAMFITMLVSGAIYALLSSGQNAFRREPEVSDRQQNIRLAMDVISKDILNAGSNIPAFAQIFTISDPGGGPPLDGLGPPGAIGPQNSDVLEMIEADDRCPPQSVCTGSPAAGAAGGFWTREPTPACLTASPFALLTDNVNLTVQPLAGGASGACAGGVNLGAAVAVGSNPVAPPFAAPGGGVQAFLYAGRVVRYMIAPNAADPVDALTPVLWRSVTGRYDNAGAVSPLPGNPNSAWQMVARGIDDLQVQYMDGTANWTDSPPAAVTPPCGPPDGCGNLAAFTPIVRQVRVTLSARTTAPMLQGMTTTAGTGPNAIRGQLVNVVEPRAALWALQMGGVVR